MEKKAMEVMVMEVKLMKVLGMEVKVMNVKVMELKVMQVIDMRKPVATITVHHPALRRVVAATPGYLVHRRSRCIIMPLNYCLAS